MRVVHVKDNIPRAVYIGRWNSYYNLQRSKWANPFKVGATLKQGEAVQAFRQWITMGQGRKLLKDLPELRGRTLACWCRHDGETEPACHGDVLIELLEQYTDEELEAMKWDWTYTLHEKVTPFE